VTNGVAVRMAVLYLLLSGARTPTLPTGQSVTSSHHRATTDITGADA
jgi:hypothetical protein